MTLTYIFHSGFVLETDSAILVFDYWLDPSRVMPSVLKKPKPLYVFSSHFHEDHFTKEIFVLCGCHSQNSKDRRSLLFTPKATGHSAHSASSAALRDNIKKRRISIPGKKTCVDFILTQSRRGRGERRVDCLRE